MKVRWSETALIEIEDIFSYIHENNRSAATAVVNRIEGLTSLLGEFPLIGHLTDETGVRMLPVVRFSMQSTTVPTRSSSCMYGTPRDNRPDH